MVLVVFGFLTDFVALGVTATTTVQFPFFTPFTEVPLTLQYFFDELFTVITTFEVDAKETSRDFNTFLAVMVFFTFTVVLSRVMVKL